MKEYVHKLHAQLTLTGTQQNYHVNKVTDEQANDRRSEMTGSSGLHILAT